MEDKAEPIGGATEGAGVERHNMARVLLFLVEIASATLSLPPIEGF